MKNIKKICLILLLTLNIKTHSQVQCNTQTGSLDLLSSINSNAKLIP